LPGVPVGGISYGSNQMRIRLSRDAAAAWATTRAVVERLVRVERFSAANEP
jgi:hypothetical protein